MKRLMLSALALAAVLFVLNPAIASAQDQWMSVPFAFTVAGKDMPAGRYSIEVTPTQMVIFRQAQSTSRVEIPAMTRLATSGNSAEDVARLVFDKVGGKYLVSEYWPAADTDGYLLYGAKEAHTHAVVKVGKGN
jgi:hypothetical protein